MWIICIFLYSLIPSLFWNFVVNISLWLYSVHIYHGSDLLGLISDNIMFSIYHHCLFYFFLHSLVCLSFLFFHFLFLYGFECNALHFFFFFLLLLVNIRHEHCTWYFKNQFSGNDPHLTTTTSMPAPTSKNLGWFLCLPSIIVP